MRPSSPSSSFFFATLAAVAALHSGCSCVVDTDADQAPCLQGLCEPGYSCIADLCVSNSSPRDGGFGRLDASSWPVPWDAAAFPDADASWPIPGPDAGAPTVGWQPPELLGENGGKILSAPSVAVSDDGDVFLSYADDQGRLFVRRRAASSTAWDSAFQVNDTSSWLSAPPRIAAGPSGSAVVAWIAGSAVEARFYFSGDPWPAGWQEIFQVAPPAGPSASLEGLKYASSGVAALLYSVVNAGTGVRTLAFAASTGTDWLRQALSASDLGDRPASLDVAVSAGTLELYASYGEGTSVRSARTVYAGRRFLSVGYDTISPEDGGSYADPALAASSSGRGVAAFLSKMSPGLYAARLNSGLWDSPQRVDPGPGYATEVAADADAAGNALILFSYCPSSCSIWATGYTSSGFFVPAAQVSASNPVSSPRVALDGTGRALLAWQQETGQRQIFAAELNPPFSFTTPRSIGTSGADCSSPALDYRSGLGFAAWVRVDGPGSGIEGALYLSSIAGGGGGR